jgi:hypothetical protein
MPRRVDNSRNGSFAKTGSQIGEVPIWVPRDVDATFDPKIVQHAIRRLD